MTSVVGMDNLEFARTRGRRLLIEGDEGRALTNESKKQDRKRKTIVLTCGATIAKGRD